MAVKFTGVGEMKKNMDNSFKTVKDKIRIGLEIAKDEAENTAKQTAPWTDRTGNARNSITGSGVEDEKDTMRIALAIGMDYGKYLEVCNFGKYRVVWPTVEAIGSKLLNYFKL